MATDAISRHLKTTSKFLSLILRHQPEIIGLALDSEGWADVQTLIQQAGAHGQPLTAEIISKVVRTSDKQRFALSSDGRRIRANQGHSVAVNLNLSPARPPDLLFHGTASGYSQSIQSQGLVPGARQYVHLSDNAETALEVGKRHGKPLVLQVRALAMHEEKYAFFLSANGVWLTASVPLQYLQFPDEV